MQIICSTKRFGTAAWNRQYSRHYHVPNVIGHNPVWTVEYFRAVGLMYGSASWSPWFASVCGSVFQTYLVQCRGLTKAEAGRWPGRERPLLCEDSLSKGKIVLRHYRLQFCNEAWRYVTLSMPLSFLPLEITRRGLWWSSISNQSINTVVRRHESLMQMVHLPYQQALSHAFQAISKTIKTTILLEQSKLESKEELLALKSLYTDTQTTARQPSIQRYASSNR